MRKQTIKLIFEISKKENAFDILEKEFSNISKEKLSSNIIECGILPEVFSHDSSEEKLWAKYSDILLARSLNFLGISAEVLRARGNSADVFGKADNYTIIGDAKTFRLSRTAKNQKDFKIKALDDWRKNDTYAILAGPLYQYPSNRSQIYFQSIQKNVTLFSYVHLRFLLDFYNGQSLKKIWETGKRLKNSIKKNDHQNSQFYWKEIDKAVCLSVNKNINDIKKYKEEEIRITKQIGKEGIQYWNEIIKKYKKLSQREAIEKLIKSEKIENKIETIKKAINKDFVL